MAIHRKSKHEIGIMRQAGNIVALVHAEMKNAVKEGVSTLELNDLANKIIKANKADPTFLGYHGYPFSICASVNEQVVHGFSSKDTILKNGDIIAFGCSTSVITGSIIGTGSSMDCAKVLYSVIYPYLKERGIFIAAQCCEHLERALVVENEYAVKHNLQIVNAVPMPKAGGSSAATAYKLFNSPVLVDRIKADAGIDIGGTLIGMHLKRVAVPLKMENNEIGGAHVICARTRPRFVGGARAVYDDKLM